MIRTGDREIHPLFGRLRDNPGELAYMQMLNEVFKRLRTRSTIFAFLSPELHGYFQPLNKRNEGSGDMNDIFD